MSRPLTALLAAIATLCLPGCGDDVPAGDDPHRRTIEIYTEIIPAVATYQRSDLASEESLEDVVYVVEREGVSISLEVQIDVVNALSDWAEIRFIDELDEAIDSGEPHQPVRANSVLVGLGAVPDGPTSVAVMADRYEYADELITFELELSRRGGEWQLERPIEGDRVTLN